VTEYRMHSLCRRLALLRGKLPRPFVSGDAFDVEGHTKQARIPVELAEAMDYAIANQRDRRNLTDAELAGLVIVVDKRKARGGDHKSEEAKSKASLDAIEKSSHVTAELTGTSPKKVEKIRAIADFAEKQIGISADLLAARARGERTAIGL
jgi:hypothetical protein